MSTPSPAPAPSPAPSPAPPKNYENLLNLDIDPSKYLTIRVDDQIAWFSKKSSLNKQKFLFYKRWEFIISASVPILISISSMSIFNVPMTGIHEDFKLSTIFQIAATLLGVVVVIFSKLVELEEYYKLWKDYRLCAETLTQEKVLFITKTEPYDNPMAFHQFVKNVEATIAKDVQKWMVPTQKKEEENNEGEETGEKTDATGVKKAKNEK